MKKRFNIALMILLLVSTLFLTVSCGKSDDENNSFTYLISKQEDKTYYDTYSENPIMKYLLAKEWNDSKIDIEFFGLVSGSESDQFNNIIATGQYYDVMDMTYSNYSAEALYNMGIALDLTEYVDEYMPNYKQMMEEYPDLKKATYSLVDGEKRILQIYGLNDAPRPAFEGFCYRRDWIVKYGVDPSTGDKFEITENTDVLKAYADTVKFPSWYDETKKAWVLANVDAKWDGSDPIFISDWEWMLNIFKKAIDTEKIANGYCMSLYYPGFVEAGDLFCAFGGGGPLWYKDGTTAKFGAASDSMKAYLDCMSSWYANGWIDSNFDERTTDMFYSIDTAGVHAGRVGLWQGRVAELANQMEDDTYPATKGIVVTGARQPINDIYGTDECKMQIPYTFYQYTVLDLSIVITDSAKEKNIPALLTMIDYLYTDEGSNLGKKGFTKEQVEETQDEFYLRFGLDEGTYYYDYDENGQRWIRQTQKSADLGTYVVNAAMLNRIVVGLYQSKYYDNGNRGVRRDAQNLWDTYLNTGFYGDLENDKMTEEESIIRSKQRSTISTSMATDIPKFIKGEYNLTTDWQTYLNKMKKFKHQQVTDIYQRVLDLLNDF
ncbi:MAG: hypothetical protein K6G38_01620 [Gammaproteobacteria bacterium]|nr:hypothetical protein [Gammaproteobacteria bacterium]